MSGTTYTMNKYVLDIASILDTDPFCKYQFHKVIIWVIPGGPDIQQGTEREGGGEGGISWSPDTETSPSLLTKFCESVTQLNKPI